MIPQISDEEFAAVSRLGPAERYAHFVKCVCDSEVVWALHEGDGFILMGDDSGNEYLPVWPAARFAEAYASHGEKPEAIPLEAWLTRWLSGLERDRTEIAVFPVDGCTGKVISPSELMEDLGAELSQDE